MMTMVYLNKHSINDFMTKLKLSSKKNCTCIETWKNGFLKIYIFI